MKRGIIKALTGTMVLLLAGGCNTVYEWWDFSSESKPQEPVVSANPPAAEPPPLTNADSSLVAAQPVLVVPAESVAALPSAVVPSLESKPLPSTPVPVNPEDQENPGLTQAKEAEDALARAKERLDWATGKGAKTQFPAPYTKAAAAYNTAVKAKTAQNWQDTVSSSQATVAAVAEIESLLAALQAKEAEDALTRAKERLDWATGKGAKTQFPAPYTKAATAYNTAVKAKTAQNWQNTVSSSQATVAAVAEIESLLAAFQAKEAEDALARAKERLDWATGVGAKTQFPAPYTKAATAYNTAVKAKTARNWQNTVSSSQTTVAAVAEIESLLAVLQAKEGDTVVHVAAKEAEDALARAKERLDWATGIGAKTQFPAPYTKAMTAYNTAVKAKTAQNWQNTVSSSQATVAAVAEIESLLADLQAKEAEDALVRAKERLDWATGKGAKTQFPVPYTKAATAYNTAVKAKTAQNWQDTVSSSQATVAAVAEIESLLAALKAKEAEGVRKVGETYPKFIPSTEPLNRITPILEKPVEPMSLVPVNTEPPSTGSYIVKPGDSYWTIASQIYGDSEQWKLLYETNKPIMTDPDNPHLLFPGMALDIPPLSIPAPVASLEPIEVSVQIKEKEPEPVVSRLVSVESRPVPGPAIPGILGTVPAVQEYTVKAGDSYWSIADRFYGDVQLWRIVYEANKDRMINPDNPHLIFPGMALTIPNMFSR
ncbi:MAG: LysM peptidoglycan-binding domain-containing protein [Treponema sp.]|jgi:nucleoid-associated protein YgaU|nr:LysM peptidoglycan-binding domain-containing protein [Treponema sp.]